MEQLKLKNQLCFPFYSVSRLIIRKYQPYLERLGITYPQYLVMLVLWENDNQPVNDIARTLFLQTNTITPLLKRLENQGIVRRIKSKYDERKVIVSLTGKGQQMKDEAVTIPSHLEEGIALPREEIISIREMLHRMIDLLK